MFKLYKVTQPYIKACQFTKKIHEDLIALGKYHNSNPIKVKIKYIHKLNTEWNWHIQQLYIEIEGEWFRINAGDWILRSCDGKKKIYSVMSNDLFVKKYCGDRNPKC